MSLVVAFSGGKDSTALALRLHELGESFQLLFTRTDNELPAVREHIDRIVDFTGARLIEPPGPTLEDLILKYLALPNHRQRWCTRQIKVEPCARWLKKHPGTTLAVGLRADEPSRVGLYGDFAEYRYPLREWEWDVENVWSYLEQRGVEVPVRTDCAVCPFQRLGEWYRLWVDHPGEYARGVWWEDITGHTFRSPSRDTWPAGLRELAAEFRAGRLIPRRISRPRCRICSL